MMGNRPAGPDFEIPFAERMSRLGTETAFVVLAKAKALEAEGRNIVHLEIGEPDFDTPENIVEAAVGALRDGYTHYTAAAGMPDMREAVAKYAGEMRGLTFSAENVVITPGAKPVMFYAILALVNQGDEVIYPNPGFPIYESVINFIGARPVPIQLRMENEFRMDIEELLGKITKKTRLIIINSPQNPTGGVLTKADLEAIAQAALEHNIIIFSDEIYSKTLYEGDHESIVSIPGMAERTVILDGMSKTFAMTGWRLGYGVMPAKLADAATKLQTNCASCTAAFTQRVIPEALFGPQDKPREMVAEFKRRREVIVNGLNEIPGVTCLRPKGAFYAFPEVKEWGLSSSVLEDRILKEAGVAILSGTSFGAFGEGFLRLSYANSVEKIQTALVRIRDFAATL
jgi:aspartate/methionine/tyrosine aminotransferase